jgi:large conductance mechanosensitive channel
MAKDPTKKAKGFIAEFREFISRGNVIDMAVGVIIATAFGKITTSLVNDVVMPAIGYLFGGIDLSQFNIVLQEEVLDVAGEVVTAGVTIGIGTFISTIIDFILVALVVFCVIKGMNSAKAKMEALKKKEAEEAAAEAPAEPSAEEKLLTEIRDLLKAQQK